MLTPNTFKKQLETSLVNQGTSFYLAISGGVDSMVLYDLLKKTFPEKQLTLLHVNYGLREKAVEETAYLKELAKKDGVALKVAYFPKGEAFTEDKGRKFRYAFFKEELEKDGILLTAHHLNDLGETLLMKLTRGVRLEKWRFLPQQTFGKGMLYRPLLPFSKDEIYQYADFHHLTYFEDESNEDLTYQRNRYRKDIMPLLLNENPNLLYYLKSLNDELLSLEEKKTRDFSLNDFLNLSSEKKHIYLKQWLEGKSITLNVKTYQQLADFLTHSSKSSFQIENGRIVKQGDTLFFEKENHIERVQNETSVLTLNKWTILNEKEKIGYFSLDQEVSALSGTYDVLPVSGEIPEVLYYRHPETGDTIKRQEKSYTKKLTRFFIDEKVPQSERSKKWLVATKNQEVLWILPNEKSYLSYQSETDKISYRLIYHQKV